MCSIWNDWYPIWACTQYRVCFALYSANVEHPQRKNDWKTYSDKKSVISQLSDTIYSSIAGCLEAVDKSACFSSILLAMLCSGALIGTMCCNFELKLKATVIASSLQVELPATHPTCNISAKEILLVRFLSEWLKAPLLCRGIRISEEAKLYHFANDKHNAVYFHFASFWSNITAHYPVLWLPF